MVNSDDQIFLKDESLKSIIEKHKERCQEKNHKFIDGSYQSNQL